MTKQELEWENVPIDKIRVVNPRDRNKAKFNALVRSIKEAGLKKPISVSARTDGGFDLICGQGRLEAFKILEQETIPAYVKRLPREDQLLQSLTENIARITHRTMDTVRLLAEMRDRGQTITQISKKIGLQSSHVGGLLYLHDNGEQRLISAVETGKIAITTAVVIAHSEDKAIQTALTQALEEKKISPKDLPNARAIADVRRSFGKAFGGMARGDKSVTADGIVRAFARESERQRVTIRKAELCEKRLLFVINAFKMLCRNENFLNLLRAEGLSTLPQYLGKEIKGFKNG